MAVPSKKQFTHFLIDFWHRVAKYPILQHPKLATLRDAMREGITQNESGAGLDGQKLAAFFEEKAYRKKQSILHALAAQAEEEKEAKENEIVMLQFLQSALEQMRVAFTVLHNPLPLEAAERVLPFNKNIFEMKQDELLEIRLTMDDLQKKKTSSVLEFRGVKKKTDGAGKICFVADKGTMPEALFYRAFLECDPAFPVAFSGGTEQECETLALLCMANNIRWTCPSHRLEKANALEATLTKLSKTMNTSNPARVYQALRDPALQHYYRTTCLAKDERRRDELEEKEAPAGRKQRSERASFDSSGASSTHEESAPHFSQGWQKPKPRPKAHEPVIEVIDEEDGAKAAARVS
jgi:hypothetical protein